MSLELKNIAGTGCPGASCPTIYATNRGTIVVQGTIVQDVLDLVRAPVGESAVEIPVSLIDALIRARGAQSETR